MDERPSLDPPVEQLTTKDLIGRVTDDARLLIKTELDLARTELKSDLKSELKAAGGLGIAGICGLAAFTLVLVAVGFLLGLVLPTWGALLIVAGVVAVAGFIAGALGWKKRVTKPLATTRSTLKEDAQWAKRQIH